MSNYVLWHNPRCSKSRAALELLREHGIEPQVVEYLKTPPTREEITRVAQALQGPISGMLRSDEPMYAELGLGAEGVSEATLFAAMADHPRLIQRPLLVHGDRAIVGRPPERVLELLDGNRTP